MMVLALLLASWEQVFLAPAHAPSVHFRAAYRDSGGKTHSLEVWRDGDRRLRRRTDERLDLWGERRGRDFAYHLADYDRKLLVHVDGANLHRIGVLEGWAGLSRVVVRPRGDFVLRARGHARRPVGACRWYRVESRGPVRDVCWSARFALPLVIEEAGVAVFTIETIETGRPDPRVFALPSGGLAEIDANADLDPSID